MRWQSRQSSPAQQVDADWILDCGRILMMVMSDLKPSHILTQDDEMANTDDDDYLQSALPEILTN